MRMSVRTATRLDGELSLPGDKSLAHRALILGALADGGQIVTGLPRGRDVASTRRCLEQLGVRFVDEPGGLRVLPPAAWRDGCELDCGNSGTTARLLTGMLAGLGLTARLTGDESLSRRPMARVAHPLRKLGAHVTTTNSGLPLSLTAAPLRGTRIDLPIASAQVKSAMLLAGLFAFGTTTVWEPQASRDHTERMLTAMGAPLRREGLANSIRSGGPRGPDGPAPGSRLRGLSLDLAGDISTAAFFLAAGAAVPDARLLLRDVGVNPTRTGILDLLAEMGALVIRHEKPTRADEPVADLEIGSAPLRATTICGGAIPRLIDELPVIAVLATRAEGVTVVRDATELRHKESDRIHSTVTMLGRMGAEIRERDDGFEVHGPCPLRGAVVDADGDHRLAMALAVAGLLAEGETIIEDAGCAAISHPEFWSDLAAVTGPGTVQPVD